MDNQPHTKKLQLQKSWMPATIVMSKSKNLQKTSPNRNRYILHSRACFKRKDNF